jgi:membrane protein DedA with SNARE-associated domain
MTRFLTWSAIGFLFGSTWMYLAGFLEVGVFAWLWAVTSLVWAGAELAWVRRERRRA